MKPINIKFGEEKISHAASGLPTDLAKKVEAALYAANGKANSHTYTNAYEIFDLAKTAEKRLADLCIPKSERPGAKFYSTSGGAVPNAYKYGRKATAVCLERRSTGWVLLEAAVVFIYKDAGRDVLALTKTQDEIAVAKFRAGYTIIFNQREQK